MLVDPQSPGLSLILTGFHEPNTNISSAVSPQIHRLLHMTNDPLAKVTRRKAPGAALVSTSLPLFVPLSQQWSFRVLHHLNLTTGGWAGIL